ncbi:MAG: hypothetical protein HKN47_23260 [Pirellulaceae bacterium]|nr:hypothetical protein [Pirellulaceae bacterium]
MFKKSVPLSLAVLFGIVLCQLLSDRRMQTAQAMTAHGTEKKTMATVPLDGGMEAVVTLDHVTGDLTGYVMNRVTGQFFIRYRHNVINEFPKHAGSYLMATGVADFRGFQTNNRLASGVVYVSEETSGRVVAYGLPWNPTFATSRAVNQELQFVTLDQAATRFTNLER